VKRDQREACRRRADDGNLKPVSLVPPPLTPVRSGLPGEQLLTTMDTTTSGELAVPPNEPCPHCGQQIMDWHNEWYDAAQRRAIYGGQSAMDCPVCRGAVLWFESRAIAAPPATAQPPVYRRSAILAAQWVPVRETACVNLAGYIANHPAGRQYTAYWQPGEIQQADRQVANP
jgi:hypothetical protein